jgi:hypothetical protein
MTEADFKALLDACKPVRVMYLPGGTPMFSSPQQNANDAWKALGKKMGFAWATVAPVEGKPQRFFTAIPTAEKED